MVRHVHPTMKVTGNPAPPSGHDIFQAMFMDDRPPINGLCKEQLLSIAPISSPPN